MSSMRFVRLVTTTSEAQASNILLGAALEGKTSCISESLCMQLLAVDHVHSLCSACCQTHALHTADACLAQEMTPD